MSLNAGKSFEDFKEMRPSPANSIRARRLCRLHNRPDIRLQPVLLAKIQTSLANREASI
jgi:hypothetical protein